MSNFPFNNDKYKQNNNVNGSPLMFSEAQSLAYKILFWHTNNDTADFSQSGDGFDTGVDELTFGLVELFSDPNAIKRLKTTGEKIKENVKSILDSDVSNIEHLKNVKDMLITFFGFKQ